MSRSDPSAEEVSNNRRPGGTSSAQQRPGELSSPALELRRFPAAPTLVRAIERLRARYAGTRRLFDLVEDDVSFAALTQAPARLARELAAGAEERGVGRAKERIVRVGRSDRRIASLGALDFILHTALGELLAAALEPQLPETLHSYRRGRSPATAIAALARCARRHRAAEPDPRRRGLWVVRADVRRYSDSIPIHDGALFWRELRLGLGLDESERAWRWIVALLRPEVDESDGPAQRWRGLLFGAPTTNAAANWYLVPLDRELARLGGFAARYGDDILFAHADYDVACRARAIVEREVATRGLQINPKKARFLFWNGSGRGPDIGVGEPTTAVEFLGAAVRFAGTVALAPSKWRELARDLHRRVVDTARLLPAGAPLDRARALGQLLTRALDPRSALASAHAHLLRSLVDDRPQLDELDRLLLLWTAEAATGQRGPRAFRQLPPATLRAAGVPSTVVARNRANRMRP